MVTVSHLVKRIVKRKPFIEEALARGIINYAALADELKPEIEAELGSKVKSSAIMMALRRLAENLTASFAKEKISFKDSDITVKSDLFEITVLKSQSAIDSIRKLYNLMDFSKGDVLTVTQGIYEITMISNERHKDVLKEIFRNEKVTKTIGSLSSLTIKIPKDAVETSGFFYAITKALNWENINIIEIVSTLTEMTLILGENDVPRAFSTIKSVI